jgi:lipid A ethanolaminephosphotransferase
VIFVMGETARADRFSYNGYARDTNRYTRPYAVVNFPHVTSCGTSTAESVPCLFSHLGRADFTHTAAAANESVFGALQRLGVETFWRDNSTGCKAVCDEAHFEQLASETDPELCDTTGCFDEILLKDIDRLLTDRSRDHFIVLHQRGSHGPAYHTDAPTWSKAFVPECDLPNLRNCDQAAINNAYDNTILYSDYFVSRVIEFLQGQSDAFNVAMWYVSDHGESLGENGLYLHGFPFAFAPQEQIRVPMLFWAAPSFYADGAGLTPECLGRSATRPTSHDAVFHTLLPLFGVQSSAYRPQLDLFAECRRESDKVLVSQLRPATRQTPSDSR